MKKILHAVAFCSLFTQQVALATTFEAICGSSECKIELTENYILTPYGKIPTTRVANWGGGGSSSTDLIMGGAATYVLGPVGLLGFMAKTHDYNYAITGYDQAGNRTSIQIKFLNSKPAKEFAQQMVLITGLGMGEKRTAVQIKELERRLKEEGTSSIKSSKSLSLEEQYQRETKTGMPTKSNAYKDQSSCWSSYLSSRSDLKIWAEANPLSAQKLKKKFKDC